MAKNLKAKQTQNIALMSAENKEKRYKSDFITSSGSTRGDGLAGIININWKSLLDGKNTTITFKRKMRSVYAR